MDFTFDLDTTFSKTHLNVYDLYVTLTSIIFILAITITGKGQTFQNLDFQQSCPESKTGLCSWDLSWGGEGSVKPDIVDQSKSLLILGKDVNAVGFTDRVVVFGEHRPKEHLVCFRRPRHTFRSACVVQVNVRVDHVLHPRGRFVTQRRTAAGTGQAQ